MDDAFKLLEDLVAVPAKKKRVYTPEQKARNAEHCRRRYEANKDSAIKAASKWRAENLEKDRENKRRWRAENRQKGREYGNNKTERKAADPELFAINQAARYACIGSVTRDITANCPEPTRSKLQALVDQIRADPSAGKQVVSLLRNMRELRKLELAEMKQATETETEN